jgi:TM2 domain-containing membrane protein YozV
MKRFYWLLIFLAIIPYEANCKHSNRVIIGHRYIKQEITAKNFFISSDTTHHRKHKLIAALLAFPIIGVLGLHRAYLGTSPAVPMLYIATIGGVFGILPFTDFVLILLCKDVNAYAHNPKIFMWNKKKK